MNKKECSRFDCSKRTEFEKCQYCGLNFCPKHVTPRPVGLPEFKSNNARDKLFMIEWHKEGGHPCPDYMEYWEADQKSKEERYRRNLDIFLRSKQKVPVITVGLSKAQMRKNNKRTEKQTKLIAKQEPIIKEQKEKTEIKEEIKVKEKEQPKKSKKIVIIGVIILVLIVIFVTLFVYKFTISKEIDVNETKTIFVTKNITRQIPIKTSFEEYFNQLDYYTTMDVTIEGSLYNPAEGSATAGVYVYYISDDYGRKILLLSLNSDQKSLFIKKGITPDIYAVQGTLRRKMTGLELTVNKIDDAQRTTEEVVQPMQVAENITQTVKKLTAYNFTIIELIKEYLNK